jgi:hypothetical protein
MLEMANVLTFVWLVIAYIVTSTALMVWIALMLPRPVEAARRRLETRPGRSFALGLLFWIVTMVFAMSLLKEGRGAHLQLLGWAVMAPGLASSVIGGAAFAELVAARIRPQLRSEAVLPALIGGALCTTLSGLLPLVGWVVFFPIVSLMAIGSGAAGILEARRATKRARQPQPVATSLPDASGFLLTEHQG